MNIKAQIIMLIAGRQMVATTTALSEFAYGVTHHAGPTESQSALVLTSQIQREIDNPSARILAIPPTKAFDAEDHIIFGTGDNLGIPTLTGNTRALNYVYNYVPNFSGIGHAPARLREKFV